MRVIFLDIDGVLSDRSNGCRTFNDMAASQIALLCHETRAVIVITSAWRGGDNLHSELRRTGLMPYAIGETPRIDFKNGRRLERGDEIQAWLNEHRPYIDTFVIIDDDADMGKLRPRLIQVIRPDGLIWPDDCVRASEMLTADVLR